MLKVPFGYVGGLQVDPVEKKPFFHALPGARALSFGMLGCDYHCGYCFTGSTVVLTDQGASTLAELFARCESRELRSDAELAFPVGRRVFDASGQLRPLKGVVRHPYRGDLIRIRPHHLPPIRCTPDHRFYAAMDSEGVPGLVRAADLTPAHRLVVPRSLQPVGTSEIDVQEILRDIKVTYRIRWDLPVEDRALIASATAVGVHSRELGRVLGKSPSYVRHVRSKLARGMGTNERIGGALVANGFLRFPGEHAPGIPARLPLDTRIAALLGYYCAEGCVTTSRRRPNSHVINFSFARSEPELVERVRGLLEACLGLKGRIVSRPTTLSVAVTKASAALLFKVLAGGRSTEKRVPPFIASGPLPVVRAFLDAYVDGDGHRYPTGKVSSTTVSRTLAYGIAALALRLGLFPSVYESAATGDGLIQGRRVKRAPRQYSVVWYEQGGRRRRLEVVGDHYLVPIRSVDREAFDGDVYNMEVDEEHSYLAGLVGVANCQNWLTSQALRDPDVRAAPQEIAPAEIVQAALDRSARIVTSTYNEPLITSEWGMAVFREAKRAGLVCSYVSNGNATPEVLDYIQPYVSLYKVDLKSFRDRQYRELGGHAGACAVDDPRAARAGFLAGDRDARDPRLQRLGRGAARDRGVPGVRVARHPVARHGLPQGLQDDGSGRHQRRDAPARVRHRLARRACASCTRATCLDGSAAGRTPTARAAPRSSSSAWVTASCRIGWPAARARTAAGPFRGSGTCPVDRPTFRRDRWTPARSDRRRRG